jgi:hypothetical protein
VIGAEVQISAQTELTPQAGDGWLNRHPLPHEALIFGGAHLNDDAYCLMS